MNSKVISLIFCLVALHVGYCFPLSGGHLDFPDPLNSIPTYLLFLVSGATFILLIYAMIGCVCCPNRNIKALSYQNGLPIHENNSSLENQTEFAIFPPHSAVIDLQPLPVFEDKITFEPLPDILPRKISTSQPAHFKSFLKNAVSLHDWFDDPNCNFPRDQLQYINELGVGWFGRVVEGEASHILKEENKTKAIIKILREEASPTEHLNFLYEALPYRDLYHPNLVRLLGRCLESDPFLLIMEHNLGDLKSYLLRYDQKEYLMKNGILLRIAYNVAAGLKYLHKCGFTHVDLAAHNCFIFPDMTAKIGDYGISFNLHRDDYYCIGGIALPIRWYSPETLICSESIIETKPLSKEANVWAFGIVVWEIFQFGNLPYDELSNEEVLQKVLIEKSVQLPPISWHYLLKDELYLIMKECWKDVSCRPTMQKVEKFLCQLYNDCHNQSMLESFEERWNSLPPKYSDSNRYSSDINHSSEGDTFSSFENSFDLLNHNSRLSPSLNVLNGSTDELTENDVSLGGLSDSEHCYGTFNHLTEHTFSYNITPDNNCVLSGTEDETKKDIIDAPKAFSDLENKNDDNFTIPFIIIHEAPSQQATDEAQIVDMQLTNVASPRPLYFVFKEHSLDETNCKSLDPDFSASRNELAIDTTQEHKNLDEANCNSLNNPGFIASRNVLACDATQEHKNLDEVNFYSLNNPDFSVSKNSKPLTCLMSGRDEILRNAEFLLGECGNVFDNSLFQNEGLVQAKKKNTCVAPSCNNPDFIPKLEDHMSNKTQEPSASSPLQCSDAFNSSENSAKFVSADSEDTFNDDSFQHGRIEPHTDFQVNKASKRSNDPPASNHKSNTLEFLPIDSFLRDSRVMKEASSLEDIEITRLCEISVESLSCTSHSMDEDFKTAQSTFANKSPINSQNERKVTAVDCALPILVNECPSEVSSGNSVQIGEAPDSRNSFDFEEIKHSEDILNREHDISLNTSYSVDDIKFSSSESTPFSMSENLSNAEANIPLVRSPFDQYISSKEQEIEESSVDFDLEDQESRMQSAGNLRNLKQNSSFLNYSALTKHEAEKDDKDYSSKAKLCLKPFGEVVVEDLETGEQTIITETYSTEDYENSVESDEILKINIETDEAIIVDSSEALIGFVPSRSIELLQECEIMPAFDFSELELPSAIDDFNIINESHESQSFRNFSLRNEVIEEEITGEITTPSSVHSTASFSSNEIFTEGEEKMSQGSESYHQMEETSVLPVMEHFYSESDDGSKTDISNSCSDEPLETRRYLTDIENNRMPDEDVMHSWQPLQSIRWNSDDTIDLEKNTCKPVIKLESQEILAGCITVGGITTSLSHIKKEDCLNIKMFEGLSPYSSVESSPCRDSVYTPDFESESDDTGGRSTSCSSTSGSFECIHNKFKNTMDMSVIVDEKENSEAKKVFSKTWDCTATPTKSVLVSPEKKFSSMRKSVSFHEEDPQVVFEYPPATYSSEEEEEKGVHGVLGWDIDFNKYADWELGENEEVMEIEELDSEPYVRRPTSSTSTIYSLTSELSDDDDIDSLSRAPSNSPEESKHVLSDLEMSRLVYNQLNKLVLVESVTECIESVPNITQNETNFSSVNHENTAGATHPKNYSSHTTADETGLLQNDISKSSYCLTTYDGSEKETKYNSVLNKCVDAIFPSHVISDSKLCRNSDSKLFEVNPISENDLMNLKNNCFRVDAMFEKDVQDLLEDIVAQISKPVCIDSVLGDSVERKESALNPVPEIMITPATEEEDQDEEYLLRQLLCGDSVEAFNFEFNSGDFFEDVLVQESVISSDLNMIEKSDVEHESSPSLYYAETRDTTHL